MAESLTLELYPDSESMYLGVLIKAIEDVTKLVRDVDLAVTRQRKGRPWVVTSLSMSTPTITIKPAIDGTETVDAIANGLAVITGDAEPEMAPTHFSEDALDDLRAMRRLFRYKRARMSKLVVRTDDREQPVATIRDDIASKVDRVLRGSYTVAGSLEGTLEALNMHPVPPTFTIWERVTGRPIRCSFGKERWYGAITDLLERKSRVLVDGRVTYFRNGMPRYISKIRDIRDMTPDDSKPKGDFGTVPDLTAGKDAVDYIKSMRE